MDRPLNVILRSRRPRSTLWTALVAGAAAFIPFAAADAVASAIPDAIYSGTGYTQNGPETLTYLEGPGDFATVTFASTPTPSITLHVEGGNKDPNQGFSSDGLTYYYQITGAPTDNGLIAAQIATTLNASARGFVTTAFASLTVNDALLKEVCAGNSGNCDGSLGAEFSGSISELLPTSGSFRLSVGADVYDGVGDAFIDPVITVPTGYTIAFSAGIGNSTPTVTDPGPSSIPEPSSIVLMLAGIVGLGAAGRRKGLSQTLG